MCCSPQFAALAMPGLYAPSSLIAAAHLEVLAFAITGAGVIVLNILVAVVVVFVHVLID